MFSLILTLLVTATLMAVLSNRLRQPTLLGYLIAGVVLGSSVSGIVHPDEALTFMAELGVVLLMFMMGLEFSVGELWAARRRVLIAGGLQTLLTSVVIGAIVLAIGATLPTAVLLGGAAAMSSTAIAAKQLGDRGELTTRYGHMIIAVLIFQDVATIPLLTLLEIWSVGEHPTAANLFGHIGRTLSLFVLAAALAKPILHPALAWVSRHGTADVFLLAALLVVVGAAFGANALGLSPALGAFLVGMVLGESDFKHRIEDDIRPFRDLFVGIFFITIGLQLDARQIIEVPINVLLWLALLIPLKMLSSWPAMRIAGLGRLDAARSAIILGHGGEFGLLIVAAALRAGIVPAELGQPALVALTLSMSAAPIIIHYHDRLASTAFNRNVRSLGLQNEQGNGTHPSTAMQGHIIICGAGNIGRLVAQAFSLADVPYLLVESDYEVFRSVRADGLNVLLGDASRLTTFKAAGGERAGMVIITFHHLPTIANIAHALRHEYPNIAVIATCLTDEEARRLLSVPGLRVYPEKIAVGLALAEQALLGAGFSAESVDDLIVRLRRELQVPIDQEQVNDKRSP